MGKGLKILVIDDTRTKRVVLDAMLRKMGHTPVLAESGEEAITLFKQDTPDIVLVDVMMPGMNGYDTVRALRRISDTWVPMVFISSLGENQDVVKGIQAGADDYLTEPINYSILEVKVTALTDRVEMAKQLADQSRQLLEHQAKTEEEGRLAQDFMRRLAALDKIDDPLVRFRLIPAEAFSGDLIAVARTPAGQLHVMLADSTGHGLTSALAVMPVLQPFQIMSQKGFSISAIAGEINRKIKEYLPQNRFVAAILLSLDVDSKRIEVWNGGCPPGLVISPSGEVMCRFTSKHLPLGILDADDFDGAVSHHFYSGQPCQVMLFSDGALDCISSASLEAAQESLVRVAAVAAPVDRLEALESSIGELLEGLENRDDIALIVVDCPIGHPEKQTEPDTASSEPSRVEAGATGRISFTVDVTDVATEYLVEWDFSLVLGAQQLKRLDVVPLLLGLAGQIESENSAFSGKLFLVMSELFNNALDHGLLKLDSTLKHDPTGMERYYEQRSALLKQLEQGEIAINLKKIVADGKSFVQLSLRDSGEGFDYHATLASAEQESERRHGRGIALVRTLGDALVYRGNGSEVEVCIQLD